MIANEKQRGNAYGKDQTVAIIIVDSGKVTVKNITSGILTVTNNAANGLSTGETVTIGLDIADGYALNKDRPFLFDYMLSYGFNNSISLDGETVKNFSSITVNDTGNKHTTRI